MASHSIGSPLVEGRRTGCLKLCLMHNLHVKLIHWKYMLVYSVSYLADKLHKPKLWRIREQKEGEVEEEHKVRTEGDMYR